LHRALQPDTPIPRKFKIMKSGLVHACIIAGRHWSRGGINGVVQSPASVA
jgi:hypothetical protein